MRSPFSRHSSLRPKLAALLLATAPAALAFGQPAMAQNAPAPNTPAPAADPAPAIVPDANAPKGKLSDVAVPVAYRLDLTIQPERTHFSGHTEIDVDFKKPLSSLYMHGRDLAMAGVMARVGGAVVPVKYTQVDELGVVRLDFAKQIPAGRVTLVFDYDAPFSNGGASLFHVKVADKWYAWTQFESIDARGAFPGFDQPGFKTPFTVTLTTAAGQQVYSNAPEASETPLKVDANSPAAQYDKAHGLTTPAEMVVHRFAPTKPLPTYLVAFGTGPFAVAKGEAAPTPERATPLAVRVLGTQPNKDKLDFALQNTGPIVGLLEKYFGEPFPFPKLDQIGSPIMGGAMENAGADTYADDLLFLDHGASTSQKQEFGMVVAHELSHQWFGDLVTPAWWDDIWLNESFANWMGYRIGNEWQPDLKIGAGAIDEAFQAMNIDALKAGRPIHQPIATSGEIDSAFDQVTYGKGGQVVAMIAAYLGDAKFQQGVRLHLQRHAYGNATTDEFFASLADVAKDPRVVDAMKSFVDQQGVPVVHLERKGGTLQVSQKRYALLGSQVPAQSWTIPLCVRVGDARQCQLLDKASGTMTIKGSGAIMPNAGGTGYYRFAMPDAEWAKLIATAPTLVPGEALALTDSLWASYQAGEVSPSLLVSAMKAMAANPYSGAAVDGGERLSGLHARGLIAEADLPAYRAVLDATYAPRLKALGFDPKAGAYASDDPDRQKLRTDLIGLLAGEAEDKPVQAALAKAAGAYLGGDASALDQSLYGAGFGAYVADGGAQAAQALYEKGVASEDSLVRRAALRSVGASGKADIGQWVLDKFGSDDRLRGADKLTMLAGLISDPATRDMGVSWLIAHYDMVVKDNGIFVAARLPSYAGGYCSVEKADEIEKALRPKVEQYQRGGLDLDRVVERIHDCGVLMGKRGAEWPAALRAK
ncbi:M1 family metallopeptidase [Novosphingobium sp. 9]|uniref:M1 family metallopeptidase n=1 Tax=Novosphingobium sp. 9 TaxID=2025349 RepID=UPI0021B69561|nr:M1 family metallopeptidase [Novosphingobium sp. 9]